MILGIGNTLLTDEGAGIHALDQLRDNPPCNLHHAFLLDGGTLSFSLLAWIEECTRLIVLDAAELDAEPGTVKTYVGEDMDHFVGTAKRSAHEVGLIDLLDIARITGDLPQHRALIGVQPESLDWGLEATAAVQAALPVMAREVCALMAAWADPDMRTAEQPKEAGDYNDPMPAR